jgi:hypothetical protein
VKYVSGLKATKFPGGFAGWEVKVRNGSENFRCLSESVWPPWLFEPPGIFMRGLIMAVNLLSLLRFPVRTLRPHCLKRCAKIYCVLRFNFSRGTWTGPLKNFGFCWTKGYLKIEFFLYIFPSITNTTLRLAEGIMADLWRGFWIRETGTGEQVAQLHDRYTMMMTNKTQSYTIYLFVWNVLRVSDCNFAHHQELKTVHTASGTSQTVTATCL